MLKQNGFDARWRRIHDNLRPYLPSSPVLGALALLLLGAGLVMALPDSDEAASPAAAANAAATPVASGDDSLCGQQSWPYIDQRCAARVETARGSRNVRIVTDKGTTVNTVTPMPVVEKKRAPQPAQPTVAKAEPQPQPKIGPTVIPAVAQAKPEPETTGSAPAGSRAMASANMPPAATSRAPVSPGVDAIDTDRPKSRSARAAEKRAQEKAQRREAKLRKFQNAGVPDEVIAAVEEAARRDRGRTVTVESPRGRRVIVVPSDSAW